MRRVIVGAITSFILCAVSPAIAQKGIDDAITRKTPEQLKAKIANQHPAVYYVLAMKLFEANEKDEAVFWFYAGQLRYRFHLAAHPELDPSGDPALLASLSETVGRPINEYAFGDLVVLDKTLVAVRAWDEKTANGFTSKADYAEQWKATRDGMQKLAEYIRANPETIRAQRKAGGLENRN